MSTTKSVIKRRREGRKRERKTFYSNRLHNHLTEIISSLSWHNRLQIAFCRQIHYLTWLCQEQSAQCPARKCRKKSFHWLPLLASTPSFPSTRTFSRVSVSHPCQVSMHHTLVGKRACNIYLCELLQIDGCTLYVAGKQTHSCSHFKLS